MASLPSSVISECGVLQVEALVNLLERLVDGVADLLHIHFADDVE